MEASKAATPYQSGSEHATRSGSSSIAEVAPPAPTPPGSAFLFDRAQMERERLERLKRLRPDFAQASSSTHTRDDEDEEDARDTNPRSAKRQRVSPSSHAPHTNVLPSSRTASPASGTRTPTSVGKKDDSGDGLFFDGELRQTANKHVDAARDTRPVFRLTDILAPRDDIVFAIVSAYVINLPWFYSFFNRGTPVVIVTQDPAAGNETLKEVLPDWIKTTPFLRNGRGCQHMKVTFILFYRTSRLRMVISTANFIEYDWRDIENSVWLQDVPPRPSPIAHDSKANDFPMAFMRVLRGVNVAPALLTLTKNGHSNLPLKRIEELRMKWDFSKIKVALIPSLAGKHEGWPKVIQTGHTALMKALQDMGARTPKGKELVLECQGSSIGTYTTQWLNEFYVTARGESAESWLDQPRARRARLPFPLVKILFPTRKTVQDSALGEPGGGTMFCRRAQWQGANFPRELFHDSKSKRGRVLMHSKLILATFRDSAFAASSSGSSKRHDTPSTDVSDDEIVEVPPPPGNEDFVGWAYVGSHNFTPSAWGTLSGSAFNPTLNITNYELGVLVPLRSAEEVERVACWERPPPKYNLGRDEPWVSHAPLKGACWH
ncbi:uncharacterized protein PHACADRAFT_148739 [Phanerochaete carnosa HHB-10118-sp]|uniref:PLD phosphodiesterase domain-containing protein n=1 Tax=Phanerochaete carnosa (strain HHB-10118-sp) TaxID=650164 RepID=K5VLD9_PHACS|nr:uncharacterized protein PHACADRAFT_148739 [Phanerochaete carnosa HHB-10118-sp]EKM52233.1 hypothetical protein PHACADRAFT_148739 [Phanerochaete carnosa HHB-10118-sp]